MYVLFTFLIFRINEVDEIQEDNKEIVTTKKKKKKKKPIKNVFKVEEVIPKNSDGLQNGKGSNSKQLTDKSKLKKNTQNEHKMIKNVKKTENGKTDNTQKENIIIKNVKKPENSKINNTQNENKIVKNAKKAEDSKIDQTPNKNQTINNFKKTEKDKINSTQNKNKTVKKGEKRKIDHTQNGLYKKQKFSVKKYKPNKEPSALESMTDDRLKAYGINPKKFRNKLRFGNNQ